MPSGRRTNPAAASPSRRQPLARGSAKTTRLSARTIGVLKNFLTGDNNLRPYKPAMHLANLIVNAALTLSNFVFETFEYQKAQVGYV